jgi:hypothetical protein
MNPRFENLFAHSKVSLLKPNNVEDLNIPLKLFGIMDYFEVRTPTINELHHCQHLELTSSSIEWEPYSLKFPEEDHKYQIIM